MTKRGLSPDAFSGVSGELYAPYISAQESPREFTWRAGIVGAIFGALFGAANAYLGLRVGLTISTSIPIAVLSVVAFFLLPPRGKISSILETNISQTIGSASSSLASGMIFTIPALYLWGYQPPFAQLVVVSLCGGLLGVLFMIPLRKPLIKGEHGILPYPEGTACAGVMVAADQGAKDSMPIFRGIVVGGVIKFLASGLRLFRGEFDFHLPFVPKAQVALEASPALLGVGYILGIRIGAVMVGGSFVAWIIIIPLLALWGEDRLTPLYPEMDQLIRTMSPGQLWQRYVRYIGAGAVAFGGFLSLAKSLPTIWQSFQAGWAQIKEQVTTGVVHKDKRTDQDLSLAVVIGGALAVVLLLIVEPHVLAFMPSMASRTVSALLIAVFAFFFVTVSSRIVGMVGVTSNPTSGMTIATLAATCAIFAALGWMGTQAMAQALLIGAIVATAASIAGDTSQDLKTGFLLGATPRKQQLGELLGVVVSVSFVCLALVALHKSYGFGSKDLPAPQAMLMKVVIEGILDVEKSLPWPLVWIGVGLAGVAALFRLPVLAFAVGVYLPLATMLPVFLGGLIRWFVETQAKERKEDVSQRREQGILFGSGLVAGEGLIGVGIAFFVLALGRRLTGFGFEWAGILGPWIPLFVFLFLATLLYHNTRIRLSKR